MLMRLPQHESELKTLTAERIKQRALPAQLPKTVWAGQGSGEPCALCDRTIDKTEMEYELDTLPAAAGANSVVRLHVRCHGLWQHELVHLSEQASSTE